MLMLGPAALCASAHTRTGPLRDRARSRPRGQPAPPPCATQPSVQCRVHLWRRRRKRSRTWIGSLHRLGGDHVLDKARTSEHTNWTCFAVSLATLAAKNRPGALRVCSWPDRQQAAHRRSTRQTSVRHAPIATPTLTDADRHDRSQPLASSSRLHDILDRLADPSPRCRKTTAPPPACTASSPSAL